MTVLQRNKSIVVVLIVTLLFMVIEKSAEAGIIDEFWSIVYWVGGSLSKTSVGQFLERGFDGFFGLFGVHFTGYVIPDYWGALTGTYSKEIGIDVPISGRSEHYVCKLLQPRMSRASTSSDYWDYDEFVKSYLKECYQVAEDLLLKSAKNFPL
jgi:hypothetical protein